MVPIGVSEHDKLFCGVGTCRSIRSRQERHVELLEKTPGRQPRRATP